MNELVQVTLIWAAALCSPVVACDIADGTALATPRATLHLSGTVQVTHGPRSDPWLGSDKFRHVGASWAATTFTYAVARSAGADRDGALLAAVPTAVAAGIAKELMDRRRGDRISVRDLVADAVGIGAAYFVLREVR